jgi:hypothetical protein
VPAALARRLGANGRIAAAVGFGRRVAEREGTLLAAGATATQAAEQAELNERTRAQEFTSAEFGLRVADSELRLARAALLRLETPRSGAPERFAQGQSGEQAAEQLDGHLAARLGPFEPGL